jgi:hypothetical protein
MEHSQLAKIKVWPGVLQHGLEGTAGLSHLSFLAFFDYLASGYHLLLPDQYAATRANAITAGINHVHGNDGRPHPQKNLIRGLAGMTRFGGGISRGKGRNHAGQEGPKRQGVYEYHGSSILIHIHDGIWQYAQYKLPQ